MPERIRKKHRQKTFQKSILASTLASQTAPKSSKIACKSGAQQSLFRDAMETTWKSSEINGACEFWTAKLALHMIRSTLSIYLSIYLSIDLPLVALIIKVSPATWFALRKYLSKIHSKSIQKPFKIYPKSWKIAPKSKTRSKSAPKTFYWFFEGPGPPKIHPKSQKIAKKL